MESYRALPQRNILIRVDGKHIVLFYDENDYNPNLLNSDILITNESIANSSTSSVINTAERLIDEIMTYLIEQPFKEVVVLINKIHNELQKQPNHVDKTSS